jgi:hypothetical protein
MHQVPGASADSASPPLEEVATPARHEVASLIERYRTLLKISQNELAGAAGLFNSQLSNIEGRTLSKEHLCRLAWAIATLSEEKRGKDDDEKNDDDRKNIAKVWTHLVPNFQGPVHSGFPRGRVDLDRILNSLLTAGGYAAIRGAELGVEGDQIWTKLARSRDQAEHTRGVLRIGWWGGFEYFSSATKAGPTGLAIDISRTVCDVLNLSPEFVEKDHFDQLIPALHNREIDVIAPILNIVPPRLFDAEFSTPVPYPSIIGLRGLIRAGQKENYNKKSEYPLSIHYVKGTVGENLYALFDPDCQRTIWAQDFVEACQTVRDSADTATIHCVIGDTAAIATEAAKPENNRPKDKEDKKNLVVVGPRGSGDIKFPFAFCLHPGEARLRRAIDVAIDVLARSNYFEKLKETSRAKQLEEILRPYN